MTLKQPEPIFPQGRLWSSSKIPILIPKLKKEREERDSNNNANLKTGSNDCELRLDTLGPTGRVTIDEQCEEHRTRDSLS